MDVSATLLVSGKHHTCIIMVSFSVDRNVVCMLEHTSYFLTNLQAYISGSFVHQDPSNGLLCSSDGIWDLKHKREYNIL